MHQNFILRNMDYVYFIYGIAFIWLALLLHPLLRVPALASKLRLRWLISFAVCHGLNEWLDMFALVVDPNPLLATIRLSALSLSFLFLLEFCRLTWGDVKGRTLGRWIYLLLIPLATQAAPLGWAGMNAMARYL